MYLGPLIIDAIAAINASTAAIIRTSCIPEMNGTSSAVGKKTVPVRKSLTDGWREPSTLFGTSAATGLYPRKDAKIAAVGGNEATCCATEAEMLWATNVL